MQLIHQERGKYLLVQASGRLDASWAEHFSTTFREIITKEKLTAMMVTHSMQQAVDLPERIVMMHRGRIVADLKDEMKARARVSDLIRTFERVQKLDLFDHTVAELLDQQFV